MTVGKWNAEAWHAQHSREPTQPRDKKPWLYVAVAAFILTAAGVSATQAFDGQDMIGVCHQAGGEYVFLPVSKDGFEHGHHRHHAADYFVAAESGRCGSVAAAPEQNTTEPTLEAPPVLNETVEVPEEPVAPVEEEASVDNSTAPTNETEAVPIGDVALIQTADQDDKKVRLSLTTTNVGEGTAFNVSLADDLPDLRRTWSLSGPDAKHCVLNGAALRCWFGDLAPGESREVVLSAYTDRMPCGDGMTNTATLVSAEDAEERNNASSASILARYC